MTERTNRETLSAALTDRPDDAHKGSCGTLLSVCGSYGMAGAALMAGKAALRCGIGLLKCALPNSVYPIAAGQLWESVYLPLSQTESGAISAENLPLLLREAQSASALLVGCGLSLCGDTRSLTRGLIGGAACPLVLDADALNCIADDPDVLKTARFPVVITPHPGEMGRLTGKTASQVNAAREQTALDFAQKYGVVTVLKGAGTVTAAPDGRVLVNPTGNSGMATGGSGDVLAGMLASLLAQNPLPFETAAAAVYLHGKAGDLAAEAFGKRSLLPTDIISFIPKAFENAAR